MPIELKMFFLNMNRIEMLLYFAGGICFYVASIIFLEATSTTTDRAICPGSKGLFVPVLKPGQGRRDKSAGVFCPGW